MGWSKKRASKRKNKRLQEQLKFFGASKTGFISCYAKKPRVRVAVKTKSRNVEVNSFEKYDFDCSSPVSLARIQALSQHQSAALSNLTCGQASALSHLYPFYAGAVSGQAHIINNLMGPPL